MLGRSGFHGLLRNLRVSPWTRRSLTESLLLNRAEQTTASSKSAEQPGATPLSPSASLTRRAREASILSTRHKDKSP